MKNTCKSLLWLVLVGSSAALSTLPAQAFTHLSLTQTLNNPDPEISDQFGLSVSIDGTYALIGARGDAGNVGAVYLFDTLTGNLLQTLKNPTPQTSDQFGYSVSISNTNALIGAINDDTGAMNAGSAYLFDTVSGNLLHTFNNPTPQLNDRFGWSVSISGTNALIGAINDDTAYLFDTETGDLLQTFNNPTPQLNDRFGYSVSIDDTNALIGDDGDDIGAGETGSAHLFDTETGNLLQTFNNPDPQLGDRFGISVSIDGINALIGAGQDNTGATEAGSAYLFDIETGNLLQTFNNPDPQDEDGFGISVSIDGTNALIGAGGDFNGTENRGSAYLFDIIRGDLLQTFNNPTPQEDEFFGTSVSISGTNALIGANNDDIGVVNAGSAYLFDIIRGDLLQTFNNPNPQEDDFFGNSVSISGTNALIGAVNDNTGAENTGSAYLFQSDSTSVPENSSVFGLFLITGFGVLVTKHRS